MDGVTPGMVVGAGTEAIAAEGRIVTAGGDRCACAFHLPATGLGGLVGGHYHA